MADTDIFFATISELSEGLHSRKFSALELTRAFGERLEQYGPRYNALALSLRSEAVRAAKDVDDDLQRERYRGPLQGIPYAVKDLLAVQGHPTTWGAKPFAGQVFDYDARVVQKIRKSGGLLIGKLAMVELAGGGGYRLASASLFGAGLNPWDRSRWSGGSSSGSGSAVAAGLVPYAIGSETSGSILTPSAFCGVTGLRPTYGLVSRYGAMALSWTMDKLGPMCRSAEDCALVLQVIAGKDPEDPGTAGKGFYYTPQYGRALKDIKVGFAPADFDTLPDANCRQAFVEALAAFRSLGTQMIETRLPDLPFGVVTGTVITAEGSSIFEPIIRDGRIDQLADAKQVAGLRAGLEIPAHDYLKSMRVRRIMQQELRRVLRDVDVLLAPSRYGIAPKVSEPLDGPAATAGGSQPANTGMRGLIPAGNLAGLPAISLPAGFADKMPIAIQLVSRPFTENMIVHLGTAFQKATNWHRQRPQVEIQNTQAERA